jgi:hypothetical protein
MESGATLDYNERAVLLAIANMRTRGEAAEAEVARLRPMVTDGVRSGMAGASRAYQEKIDEANLSRDVAIIERDEAREALSLLQLDFAALDKCYKDQVSFLYTERDTAAARAEAAEAQLAEARECVDDALGDTNSGVPLVDRIMRLVSVLANSTTPAEVDANEGRATVDELARRVDVLELALTGNADQYGNLVRRVEALEATVTKLDDSA